MSRWSSLCETDLEAYLAYQYGVVASYGYGRDFGLAVRGRVSGFSLGERTWCDHGWCHDDAIEVGGGQGASGEDGNGRGELGASQRAIAGRRGGVSAAAESGSAMGAIPSLGQIGVACGSESVVEAAGGDRGVVGSPAAGMEVGVKEGVSLGVRGKHYARNRARREKVRLLKRSQVAAVGSAEGGAAGQCGGADEGPPGGSRAELYQLRDEQEKARIRHNLKRYARDDQVRLADKEFEFRRLTADDKLRKITEARFGAAPGYAETLISTGLSSTHSVPAMTPDSPLSLDSSISPESSASMAEVHRMEACIRDQAARISELEKSAEKMRECMVSAGEVGKLEKHAGTSLHVRRDVMGEVECDKFGKPFLFDAFGYAVPPTEAAESDHGGYCDMDF